jgi:magnesium transporter
VDSAIVAALQFPNLQSTSEKNHLIPATLRIVITVDRVITVHPAEFPSSDRVRDALRKGRIGTSVSSARFIGEFLMRVVGTRFQFIDELNVIASRLEKDVFAGGHTRDLIQELMALKMTISKARQIAPPQKEVVAGMSREIQRMKWSDGGVMEDVGHQINHVVILLEGLKDRAEIVTEANEAFLNHSLNSTLKLLTIFSVLMITPTLVAGAFGMNVRVPWQEHSYGFVFVSAILGIVTLAGVFFLKFRRWF